MVIDNEIDILLRKRIFKPEPDQIGILLPALEQEYARIGSAFIIAGSLNAVDKDLAISVLMRAGIEDPDDTVRRSALEALGKINRPEITCFAFASATFDAEELVREVAIELLWYANKNLARRVAQRLVRDPCSSVAKYASEIIAMDDNDGGNDAVEE